MATESSNESGRSVGVDILSASKTNDEKIEVWTTQNFNQQNKSSPRPDFRNTDSSSGPRKLSLFLQRKQKRDGVKKVESRKREVKQQTSETRLTFIKKFASWRYVMVLLLQSSYVVTVFWVYCLPMAMVCMVGPPSSFLTSRKSSNTSNALNDRENAGSLNHTREQFSLTPNITKEENHRYEFDWNSEVQGLVLTAVMFPGFLGPILTIFVTSRLGSKWTLTTGTVLSAVLVFLSPSAARLSPYCLVVVRILLGFISSSNTVVSADCIAWWAPQDEKLTMSSLTFTGVNVGSILTSFLSGYLCLVPMDNGWPFVFYTFGAVTLVWVFLWHFLSSQKPEDHPYISEKEKQYIVSHRVGMDVATGGKKAKPPYSKILKSLPTIAYLSSAVCHFWATSVLFTYLPKFFSSGLNFSTQNTGLLVSLTSVFRMLGTFFWTVLGNKISTWLDIRRSRKICICVGFTMAGLCAVVVGFVEADLKWVSTAVLICLMLCQSVGTSAVTAVALDMAPRYAGVLNGLMVSTGRLIGLSGPLVTAVIIADGTHDKWQAVWITMAVIFFAGATIFLFFGQATLQPYALGKESAPHIISSFVTMGRRFSTFLEAPPLSPVSPKKVFNFPQSPAATDLLATFSPNIFQSDYFSMNNNIIPNKSSEPDKEITNVIGEVEHDDITDDSYFDENNIDGTVERRASSEFGLEVRTPSSVCVEKGECLDREGNIVSSESEVLKSKNDNSGKQAHIMERFIDRPVMEGVINEVFEDNEDNLSRQAHNVQMTRL